MTRVNRSPLQIARVVQRNLMNNPMRSEEALEKMKASMRLRKLPPNLLKWIRSKKSRREASKRCVARNRLGPVSFVDRFGRAWRMKSRPEICFARQLDVQELTWFYEPHTLLLSNGHRYTPDFFISESGVYIEVKGSMNVWNNNLNSVRIACSDGYKVQLARYPKFKLEFVL